MLCKPSRLLLMTGATGLIGAPLLQRVLSGGGWRVRVITRQPDRFINRNHLEVYGGDLSSTLDWDRAVKGVDVVLHAAAEINDEKKMHEVNVKGSMRLLEASVNAGVSRWVQLSSVGAYGPVLGGCVTEQWPDSPCGAYEQTKTDFDSILKLLSQQGDMEVCIVRPSNVYGPHMRNQSINHLMSIIRKGWFAYIGAQGASANYVHVDDVVEALNLCLTHPKAANQTYIVSAWATMEEMITSLSNGMEVAVPNRRVPIGLAKFLAGALQWWKGWPLTSSRVQAMSLRSQYSTQKIENELGWKVTVPVSKGMTDLSRAAVNET